MEAVQKLLREILLSGDFGNEPFDAAIENDGAAFDSLAVDDGAFNFAVVDDNAFQSCVGLQLDAVFQQFFLHHGEHEIRAAKECVNALAHEVSENDAVCDGRFVQAGAIRVGDRFEKEAPYIRAVREETIEQIFNRIVVFVVIIHAFKSREEGVDGVLRQLEMFDEFGGEIRRVKRRIQLELRVIKTDGFHLDDAIREVFPPVFAEGFLHAHGKTVEGDIEDMPFAFEIGSEPADHGMLFDEQDLVSGLRKAVGGRQTAEATAGHDDVNVIVHLHYVNR